jgi:hypothetical protein
MELNNELVVLCIGKDNTDSKTITIGLHIDIKIIHRPNNKFETLVTPWKIDEKILKRITNCNNEDYDIIETKDIDVIETKDIDVIETKDIDVIETKDIDVIETKDIDIIETNNISVIETNDINMNEIKDINMNEIKDINMNEIKDIDMNEIKYIKESNDNDNDNDNDEIINIVNSISSNDSNESNNLKIDINKNNISPKFRQIKYKSPSPSPSPSPLQINYQNIDFNQSEINEVEVEKPINVLDQLSDNTKLNNKINILTRIIDKSNKELKEKNLEISKLKKDNELLEIKLSNINREIDNPIIFKLIKEYCKNIASIDNVVKENFANTNYGLCKVEDISDKNSKNKSVIITHNL